MYEITPLTALPLLYDPEHLYPYTSYGHTAEAPQSREMRFVMVENEHLRVTVAPELGGRVYSLFDKRIGQEILYRNPVVKPTRILPIWAYISGGIEFNFPIAHSPTSCFAVGCDSGIIGDYAFVRVGEREARSGMEWMVEIGLKEHLPVVIQRTALRNPTGRDHPWMMWSNCAVRSTAQTEFIYPAGLAFMHGSICQEVRWPECGLNWEKNIQRMVGLFWNQGQGNHFGVFHHDLGFGLLHVADPQQVPGKKLWSYGFGRHRKWGIQTSDDGNSYAEIQSGPLADQAQKPNFPAGGERGMIEFWIPVHQRSELEQPRLPQVELPPMVNPHLGYGHSPYQTAWEAFGAGEGPMPASPVPPGLDLERALRREVERGNPAAREPLAVFLAFHQRPTEALQVVEEPCRPEGHRLAGLILWHGLKQPEDAVARLERGPLSDPMACVELDRLYAQLGRIDRRRALLASAPDHRRIIERKADLSLAMGQPGEALRILLETPWPLEHQRYVRTRLWNAARRAMGMEAGNKPESLGEDDLAEFGAYWSDGA